MKKKSLHENPREMLEETSFRINKFIFKEMEKILQVAHGSLKDIIRTVDYVASDGLKNYAKTDKIRKNLLGSPYPTSTGIVCERLLRKGLMIEIEAIALLGN